MIIIGTAGIPIKMKNQPWEEIFKYLRNNEIPHTEIQFVRSIYMDENKAKELGTLAKKYDIYLTVHAPYYINLNSDSEDIIKKSQYRLEKSAEISEILGAKFLVFHAGYYGIYDKKKTYERIKNNLKSILDVLSSYNIYISPETTGKANVFGSIDEVFYLCKEFDNFLPTIDFAHIYARSLGEINSYYLFIDIIDKYFEEFGNKDLHFHFSGIEIGQKGERKHLPLEDSGFNYIDLGKALLEFDNNHNLIGTCESPILEYDAILFKNLLKDLKKS